MAPSTPYISISKPLPTVLLVINFSAGFLVYRGAYRPRGSIKGGWVFRPSTTGAFPHPGARHFSRPCIVVAFRRVNRTITCDKPAYPHPLCRFSGFHGFSSHFQKLLNTSARFARCFRRRVTGISYPRYFILSPIFLHMTRSRRGVGIFWLSGT